MLISFQPNIDPQILLWSGDSWMVFFWSIILGLNLIISWLGTTEYDYGYGRVSVDLLDDVYVVGHTLGVFIGSSNGI